MKWYAIVAGGGLILLTIIVCYQFTGSGSSVVEGPGSLVENLPVKDQQAISIPESGEVRDVVTEQPRPVELPNDPVSEDLGELIESDGEVASEENAPVTKDDEPRTFSYFGRVVPEPRTLNLDLHLVSASGEKIRVTPEGIFNKTYYSNDPLLAGASGSQSIQESFSVWADSEEIERSRSLTLWPAASLSVSIIGVDAIGGDDDGLELHCELDSGWVTVGWGWARVYRFRRDRSADQQSAQQFEVRNVPPNATIWIIAENKRHSGWGSRPAELRETSVTLEPGEHRELVLDFAEGASIRGAFADEFGKAIPGYEVWVLPMEFELGAYLSPYREPFASTYTDDDGRFEFEAVEPGKWWVGPSPLRQPWHFPDEELFAPVAQLVELETGAPAAEVELVGYKGIFIRGSLIDTAGNPLTESIDVSAVCEEKGVALSVKSDNNGNFVLWPLVPGSYLISASSVEPFQAPEKVFAEAGETNVFLRYQRGGSLAGSVVESTTGEAVRCTVYLAREGAFERGRRRDGVNSQYRVYFQTEGTFEFLGLEAGTYYIRASTVQGRVGTGVVELSEFAEVRGVVIQLKESATIRVFNEIEHTSAWVQAWLGDMYAGSGYMDYNQGESISVPPGRIHVVVNLSGTRYVEVVDVKAGETKDVVFSKK